MHFTKQAVEVIISEKKNIKSPAIIAPSTLVAAKATQRSIIDVRTVPKIPVSCARSRSHTHFLRLPGIDDVNKPKARYTTAIPSVTHKNAGVKVITAVYRRIPAITPITILATVAYSIQLCLQSHS